jgi:hypothetical protein
MLLRGSEGAVTPCCLGVDKETIYWFLPHGRAEPNPPSPMSGFVVRIASSIFSGDESSGEDSRWKYIIFFLPRTISGWDDIGTV